MVYNKSESMVHVRLSPWMYQHVSEIAERLGMTRSDVIRMGINEVIKKESTPSDVSSPQPATSPVEMYNKRSHKRIVEVDPERLEQRLKELLNEQNIEEWVGQAIKTIQKEIEILQEKIQEYKQKGKTKEVARLERELTKLQQSLSGRKQSYLDKQKPLPTGTLRISSEETGFKKTKKKKKHT